MHFDLFNKRVPMRGGGGCYPRCELVKGDEWRVGRRRCWSAERPGNNAPHCLLSPPKRQGDPETSLLQCGESASSILSWRTRNGLQANALSALQPTMLHRNQEGKKSRA